MTPSLSPLSRSCRRAWGLCAALLVLVFLAPGLPVVGGVGVEDPLRAVREGIERLEEEVRGPGARGGNERDAVEDALAEALERLAASERELEAAMIRARERVWHGNRVMAGMFEAEMAMWRRDRDDTAPWMTGLDKQELESPEGRMKLAEVTTRANEWQVKWLDWVARGNDRDPISGVWQDAWGGTLYLEEAEEGLRFRFLVVRGPTAHIGEISGTAHWNESMGWFTRPIPGPEDDEMIAPEDLPDGPDRLHVSITFVRHSPFLRVDTVNANLFGGMRAYFHGNYIRTRDLTDKDRESLGEEGEIES